MTAEPGQSLEAAAPPGRGIYFNRLSLYKKLLILSLNDVIGGYNTVGHEAEINKGRLEAIPKVRMENVVCMPGG